MMTYMRHSRPKYGGYEPPHSDTFIGGAWDTLFGRQGVGTSSEKSGHLGQGAAAIRERKQRRQRQVDVPSIDCSCFKGHFGDGGTSAAQLEPTKVWGCSKMDPKCTGLDISAEDASCQEHCETEIASRSFLGVNSESSEWRYLQDGVTIDDLKKLGGWRCGTFTKEWHKRSKTPPPEEVFHWAKCNF